MSYGFPKPRIELENVLFQISKLLTQCRVVPSCVAMAGDKTDGCMPSKMVSQDEMETEMGSQPQQSDLSPVADVGVSQSQPATQPLEFSQESLAASQGLEEGVWGQLYPNCGTFPK